MADKKYYDGSKLLSMKDLNGETPEIFMATTNRSGGKTTYFSRLLVNRFLNKGQKFALLYRFNYELDSISDKFFKDINTLFFPEHEMEDKTRAKGVFRELYLDEEPCGYAIALNSADQLKKYSHLFSDVENIMFDEFQSETNHYCQNEIEKLISIHTTIARGQGKQVRYVPVYMCGNPVSLINPYYTQLGISQRLKSDTKFLRGDGYVLEYGFIEAASKAQKMSGFNKAFSNNQYVAYSAENVYLNDSSAFIERLTGRNRYLCTLKYGGHDYALREYDEQGFIYCDDNADSSFPGKITVTTDDHNINYVMLRHNDMFLSNMRYFFERGAFRFKDALCKDVVLKALSY